MKLLNKIMSLFKKEKITARVFVAKSFGFDEIKDLSLIKSTNGIADYLGYHPDKVYACWQMNHPIFYDIICEIFTKNIIAVAAKPHIKNIDLNQLKLFVNGLNFEDHFDSYNVNHTLERGIENKSLDVDFLSRVLDMQEAEPYGVFYSSVLKMNLYFSQGLLTDFQPSDGLMKWARYFRKTHPELIQAFEDEAKHYWGDDITAAMKEINIQASAIASVPYPFRNEFLDLHRTRFGAVNYRMIQVCHYGDRINLNDFLAVNHGRYQVIPSNYDDILIFKSGLFTYKFLKSGAFINCIRR